MAVDPYEPDEQDQSEVFDEDMTDDVDWGPNQHEMKTFEEMTDVYDVTSRVGDDGDHESMDEEEFTEGAIDDDELEDDSYATDEDVLNVSADDYGVEEVAAASNEVELDYADDIENRRGAQASAAHFETRRQLGDEELQALGYVDTEQENEA